MGGPDLQGGANPWVSGLPVYEPGRPLEEVARELGFADASEIIKLASNENPLGPSPRAVEAIREAAGQVHLYPDGSAWALRRALAERLELPMEQIAVGNGSNELLELLGHVYLRPDTSAVYSERAFIVYHLVTHLFGARAIRVPMADGFTHDLAAMAEAVAGDTRLVFVANPNNPTGTAVAPGPLEEFLNRLPPRVLAVVDEAYYELLPESRRADILERVRAGEPVCVVRTFSKVYGLAGLRVGYMAAPAEVVGLVNRVREPFNVNALAQVAARAALEDEEHVRRTRRMNREGLDVLAAACRERGIHTVPSEANFMLLRVGKARETFGRLQKMGVITRPMDGYGLPDYLRVSIGTPDQNRALIAALDRLPAGGETGADSS